TLAARQVAASAPSVPSAPAASRREQYRVRRHVATPTSAPHTSTPSTSSPVTASTQVRHTPALQTENVDVARDGQVDVAGSDPKLPARSAPDRGDPRSAEITVNSRENVQPLTRLIAKNE